MKDIRINILAGCLIGIVLFSACSVTKHLPEDEILYTGGKTVIVNKSSTRVGETALTEINAALAKTPSTTLLGGFLPIPFKMWMYNDFVKYKKGFGKWMFNRFAANPPVFISTVNPEVRVKVATNLLRDYGYFNGKVTYETLVDKKDSLKASLLYTVDMKNPYFIDTVYYQRFTPQTLKIMERGRRMSYITPGEQFNVVDLDEERSRISTLLRNRGYFYFRPDYMTYQADTTLVPGGHISLRLIPLPGLPAAAQRSYYVGDASVYLFGKNSEAPNDSILYKNLNIHYYDKLQVRPNMLYRWMNYQQFVRSKQMRASNRTRLYSQYRQEQVQEKLSQLGIFSYMDMQYAPRDTTAACDTLDVTMQATFAKPLDAELELNVVTKSNDQTGPGASFGVTRNNVFGGGESWNVKLKGSYEWQTGGGEKSSLMNSWEMGLSTSLTFPRVVFPHLGKREFDFPATTTFRLYINQLNRAKYYKLLSFGGNATYDFQPSRTSRHSITPFKLTFNVLQHQSEDFKEIAEANPALYVSLRNQFIPAMEYTYTYDNASGRRIKNPIWWQSTVTSAGNITSLIYRAFGKPFNEEDKSLLGAPFAQFVKLNTELRHLWNIDKNNAIASRMAVGALFTYGNATIAPYSEQFYVGGANSIRAFTVRSVGPGGYHPEEGKYSYLDQTGTFRFEANVEYRFRIFKSFWGATFLDAGNVWLLRKDRKLLADGKEARPNSQLRLKTFPKQIALGTGVGIRYDMDILVFRLDFGIPLHLPYDTDRSGYYNVTGAFFKNLGIHFAIGYPF
ncbi:BamA/TamA family outer membrane protein [Bacteroides thetaiotaomicron]|jgi:outer membrane protein assembly factor BamA|uniref:translocation and assembly module lipoprotein TamL n=1 Tax=Bacteroides thetaiotaomicron TaxID=818 RepID=UPI001C8B5182|nr:BamA/TamA family outer membrane protein [Bacteroides thetaiotaomicron]MBX9049873.1 BamA/TamA family outer membrane protein [Bacteroides thetaiotaomicron]MBX9073069.1 BamA/TamA family outer membrane protein [Bacteroides thetaiotaomicron]